MILRAILGMFLIIGMSADIMRGEQSYVVAVQEAVKRAGENAAEIGRALEAAPRDQQKAMQFLVANMPDRDLQTLSAEFLLENTRLAYEAWTGAHWHDQIPEDIFLNNVLPYASVTERRDDWRADFYQRFQPLVEDAQSPGEAAALLNNKVFEALGVKYSTKRRRADQGPFESMESGMATCTGLSILLIDACRAVGVPARFVGTPLWADRSGNHSWVEVWDEGWHYTGAAEPDGTALDAAWFTERAALAHRDEPRHAIYAVSFQRTPIQFPCVWARRIDYVSAVNVTDRYTEQRKALPDGMARVMFRVLEHQGGDRCQRKLRVESESGHVEFEGTTKDERFDANDHVTAVMELGKSYHVQIEGSEGAAETTIKLNEADQLFTFDLARLNSTEEESVAETVPGPIELLQEYLAVEPDARPALEEQSFAQSALSRFDFETARDLIWADNVNQLKSSRAEEMEAQLLRDGEYEMPFTYKAFGEAPAGGRSLFISMHGGGETRKRVNDRQWENQKTLYEPEEGIYLAPRAPTDTWNMWHQEHIDRLFARLIQNMMVFEGVDPNRVYLMGYSAGGDGVFQVAPRFADRLAAAAMMAGHPNEALPLGLRNIGFTIHMGGRDAAFQRNEVASNWKEKLAALQQEDPDGYRHLVEIYPDKGHWMEHLDASAVQWMSQFVRDPVPTRIVWWQDDVTHQQYYWLAVAAEDAKKDAQIIASRAGQEIRIDTQDVANVTVRFDDRIADLDRPVRITSDGATLFEGQLSRQISTIAKTLAERGDPEYLFASEVTVSLAEANEPATTAASP